ncbi:probable N-acetylgalactosaminyltransferase 9 [Haliotis rubra]|uniref:probable N-acetylgalactosaminyltransferase 9 n=1 Tax=Haliotis rubra TaxID=36100 RepID=UPI001EE60766|nr:probable N-acetylgalactosaminyltransferase 9 [Haliotis rubra]
MAISGRFLYMVILPLLLSVIVLGVVLSVTNNVWDSIVGTTEREKRFLEYQRSAGARNGPGEQGEPYHPPGNTFENKGIVNLLASDAIAVDRTIKDFRHESCMVLRYGALPSASVIVAYDVEAFSVLMRTLHSVVNRSPPRYLKEVLLVPFGKTTGLTEIINAVQKYWPEGPVRVISHNALHGLYEARSQGAEEARGDVLVFLDPHCEVGDGWLEPLLQAIGHHPNIVAVPVEDKIATDTLAHTESPTERTGGIFWKIAMSWRPLSEAEKKARRSPTEPIKTPIISGDVFAVAAKFFMSIGGFLSEMRTRGVELEFSYKTWMCGGFLLIYPCSRVAHLAHPQDAYNKLSTETEEKALIQVAEVWMDEYRRLFYMYRKYILSQPWGGDFAQEHLLQSRQKCNSFGWYVDYVYPEKFMPDENVYAWGVVRNPFTEMCLSIPPTKTTDLPKLGDAVSKVICDHSGNMDQTFSYTFDKTIRQEEYCLNSDGGNNSPLTMVDCRLDLDTTKWDYNKEDCMVKHVKSGLCLSSSGNKTPTLSLEPCVNQTKNQIWTFLYYLNVPLT